MSKSAVTPMIWAYTQADRGHRWLQKYRHQRPQAVCVLGFTETGLLPGISAAGATPAARIYTAVADAEFLYAGPQSNPTYPLPRLTEGVSPAFISRAVIAGQDIPLTIFNAGLPVSPVVPHIDLQGCPATCLRHGRAMPQSIVEHLFQQGWQWGERLAAQRQAYLIIGECVVGGTTTALAVLLGLGLAALGKVNSSHPQCNHAQKLEVVQQGLRQLEALPTSPLAAGSLTVDADPLTLVAGVGDPMQVVVAAMALSASRSVGVLLAGGTQMLAVYALIQHIAHHRKIHWNPDSVVVGTTRWVAEDPTGDTVGLAQIIGSVPLLATQLTFQQAHYPQLQCYENGFVKEGVGAGGCAIAAHLYQEWSQNQLLDAIETLIDCYYR